MLEKDTWGIYMQRFLGRCDLALSLYSTSLSKVMAYVFDIELGEQCKFYGIPLLRRYPGSIIRIGEQCRFRSRLRMGNQAGITRPCSLQTLRQGAKLLIGDRCGFSGAAIAAASSIEIGDDLLCGANVTITDTDWHHVDPIKRMEYSAPCSPVIIEDNVWLGMNVTVLKGVTIGKNSVIAAHSVVTKDVPSNVVAAGIPAKVSTYLLGSIDGKK